MDEPTSDMDPITRHLTYDCIRGLLRDDRAVILTSHTITEIDGVCGRIGILRRGRLVSMGSTQALQSTYGLCYAVRVFRTHQSTVKTMSNAEDGRTLERELRERLPYMESVQVERESRGDRGDGGIGGVGVQFVVRISGGGCVDAAEIKRGEESEALAEPEALRLSELCELLHRFATEYGCTYTLSECLLDQVLYIWRRYSESVSF